jgi:hypothetical protein
VSRLPSLVNEASVGDVASLAEIVAGVVISSCEESLESLKLGDVEIRGGSVANIVRSIVSRPVLLYLNALSENQSFKFAQLGHCSSRSRWNSREYFR